MFGIELMEGENPNLEAKKGGHSSDDVAGR
jgi:hypothetical protein